MQFKNYMTIQFKRRIIHEGIVDTKKYRYVYRDGKIYRIALEKLDTTAAIDGWEEVK